MSEIRTLIVVRQRAAVGLLFAGEFLVSAALIAGKGLSPDTLRCILLFSSLVGAVVVAGSGALVLALTFTADAFPGIYARLVPLEERITPITMFGLVRLAVAETLCFTNIATLIALSDPTAFKDAASPGDFLYFAVITGFTVGFGDIHPGVNLYARTLTVIHVLAMTITLVGMVSLQVSAFVSNLTEYKQRSRSKDGEGRS